MKTRSELALLVFLMSLLRFDVLAQNIPTDSQGEPTKLVVTVTTRPASVEATAADVMVAEADPGLATGQQSIEEVLRFLPGVYVTRNGPPGGPSWISIRGGDPNFTLLLIDGIPMNDITDQLGGAVNLARILNLNASRVEVVRGPVSAVYGSEAMAGAVNIVTNPDAHQPVSFSFSGGTSGMLDGRFNTSSGRGRWTHNFGFAGMRIGEQVERDFSETLDSGGRASVKLTDKTSLAFILRMGLSRTAGFPSNSGGPKFAINRQVETRDAYSGTGGVELRHAFERWSNVLEFDYFRQKEDKDTPAILDRIPPSFAALPATLSRTNFNRARVNGSSGVNVGRGVRATLGFAYREEEGKNTGTITGLGRADYFLLRRTGGLVAETVVERKRWSALGSIRSDWVSQGEQRFSSRFGTSAALAWGTRIRLSWGRGFKLPSFYALAHPLIGNRNLQPETSTAVDLGVEKSFGGTLGVVSLNLYRTVYDNLVDFSPQLFRLVNRDQAVASGIDVSWAVKLHGLTMKPHATFSSANLENSIEPLRDRPRWRFGALVSQSVGSSFSAYLELLGVGRRYDFQVPVPHLRIAPAYFVGNVGGRYKINSALSAFVQAYNVTNRRYEENIGFPSPGIQFKAGLTYSR